MFNYLFSNNHSVQYTENKNVEKNSVGVFLINLDRAKARLDFVKSNIQKLELPFHRIAAVDGQRLSDDKISKIVDREQYKKYFKMYPEKGTVGCSLSHEKVWKTFLQSHYEFALVFEDDIVFDPVQLKQCVLEAVKQKVLWDVLLLEPYHNGTPVKVAKLWGNFSMCVYFTNITHAGCYLINRSAVKKFLEKFYPISVPVDHYINAGWEFDVKFLGVEPRLVKQCFGESQIKTNNSEKFNDFSTKFNNACYNICRAILHFLYNSYLYMKIKNYIEAD